MAQHKTWIIKVVGYKTQQKAQDTIDLLASPLNKRVYHNIFRVIANEFGTYNLERWE